MSVGRRIAVSCLLFATGCSGGEDPTGPSTQGGAGGSAAGSAGQGGNTPTAGSGGKGGGGSSGTASCAGPFGAPEIVISVQLDHELASPAAGPGELELFYVEYEVGGLNGHFMRSARSSTSDFPPGTAVAELDAACQPSDLRSIDLSLDGLRAYLLCFPTLEVGSFGNLRVATRADPMAAFVLDAQTYGQVGASPAIAPDEMSIISSSEQGVALMPLMVYTRSTLDEAFGSGQVVPGLETQLLSSPDIGSDELHLYAGFEGAVVMATRESPDSDFGVPSVIVPRTMDSASGMLDVLGAPDASADCRSIYLIQIQTSGVFNIVRVSQ